MTFLEPYYLFGLFGILIPLVIHLWSRRNPNIIPFGSIRFLPESEASRSMSLRLTEKLLLLLRALILALLCLILARPSMKTDQSLSSHWILIEPSLAESRQIQQLLDTTKEEVHLMIEGFPVLDNVPAETGIRDTWSLVGQASLRADSLTVLVSNRQQNYRGKRPALSVPVTWISVETEGGEMEDTLQTYQGKSGTTYGMISVSKNTFQKIERKPVSSGAVTLDKLQVELIGNARSNEQVLLRHAVETIGEYLDIPITIHTSDSATGNSDWYFVWGEQEINPNQGKWILRSEKRPGPVILQTDDPAVFLLNGRLTAERIYQEDFLSELLELFDPLGNPGMNEKIAQADIRQMSFDPTPRQSGSALSGTTRMTEIVWPFWVLLLIVFCIERLLSQRKHA